MFIEVLLCFSRDGGDMSTRDLRNIVESLPQYSEQYEKLSLHVDVSLHCTHIFYNTFTNINIHCQVFEKLYDLSSI